MEQNIEIINNYYSQDVVITVDGIKKTIFHLDNTGTDLYCNYIIKDHYLIIYSTRIVDEEDPYYMTKFKNVQVVFDLNTYEILDLDKETLYRVFDMYLGRHSFPIEVVFSLLVGKYFTSDKLQVEYFKNYITAFNTNISREEIVNYLIKCYPNLESFKNMKYYLLNLKKIKDCFTEDRLSFNAMPQDIREYDKYIREKNNEFRKKYLIR